MKDAPQTTPPAVLTVPKSLIRSAKATQAISTALAAKLAWRWFLTPFEFRMPARELPFEQQFKGPEMLKHKRGLEYPLFTLGEGSKKLLLVHGWAGRFTQFGPLVNHLEKQHPTLLKEFTIIGYNALAHRGAQGKRTMMPEIAECIDQISKRFEGLDVVIAHSIGANATMYAGSTLKTQIGRQILIAPPGRISEMVNIFCNTLGFNDKVKKRIVLNLKKSFGADFDSYSAPELAPGNTTPTLVFHDTDDRDTPIHLGREVGKKMSNGTYIETNGLGHRRILRDEKVAQEIANFIF
jgi:pimeloyl-ACP methyl ester carboxylesterase